MAARKPKPGESFGDLFPGFSRNNYLPKDEQKDYSGWRLLMILIYFGIGAYMLS